MTKTTVEVLITADAWLEKLPDVKAIAARAAMAAADNKDAEVSLLLTDDAEIRTLNKTWRDQDKATNVLSFPQAEEDYEISGCLGDIALALETISREAEDAGIPLENHTAHLVVHGTLHLLGYDHMNTEDAEQMERRETEILAELGYPDPYFSDK